jgi:hypothetical protein
MYVYTPRIMKATIWIASPNERRTIPTSRRPVIFPIKTMLMPLSNKIKIKSASNNVPNRLRRIRKRELLVDKFLTPSFWLIIFFTGGVEQYSD